ncbi:MAG: thioredoxin domain-containing protein [bacterium]|nr:thioredoxin domain-containing protein [bacterium]
MGISKKTAILWVGGVVIILAGVYLLAAVAAKPVELDAFAQCLGDKGATFYGAFWCSHCQNQKAMFGKSAAKLPYVECSTPNGQGQLQVCNDKQIEGYPTWEFADGSRLSGEIPLETLAEKTGCELPRSG